MQKNIIILMICKLFLLSHPFNLYIIIIIIIVFWIQISVMVIIICLKKKLNLIRKLKFYRILKLKKKIFLLI